MKSAATSPPAISPRAAPVKAASRRMIPSTVALITPMIRLGAGSASAARSGGQIQSTSRATKTMPTAPRGPHPRTNSAMAAASSTAKAAAAPRMSVTGAVMTSKRLTSVRTRTYAKTMAAAPTADHASTPSAMPTPTFSARHDAITGGPAAVPLATASYSTMAPTSSSDATNGRGPAVAARPMLSASSTAATANAAVREIRPDGMGRSGRSCLSRGASQASLRAIPPAYAHAEARRSAVWDDVSATPLTAIPIATSEGAVKTFGRRTSSRRLVRNPLCAGTGVSTARPDRGPRSRRAT